MAAASIKSCEATEAPQTVVVAHKFGFGMRFETRFASDHPVRAFSERDHFFSGAATPPHEEGNELARRSRPRFVTVLSHPGFDTHELSQ